MALLAEKTTQKDFINLHWDIIKYVGAFNDLEMDIKKEILLIEKQLSLFKGFVEGSSITEPSYDSDYYFNDSFFIRCFVNSLDERYFNVKGFLNEQALEKESILSYSRDKLSSFGIIDNLKLQKRMNVLTVFIVILTLLLATDSRNLARFLKWVQLLFSSN